MKNDTDLGILDNLNNGLAELMNRKKLHIKSACCIAQLDIDAEQLWVLRFYNENGVLPTIKQAKDILKVYNQNRLTLKAFREIMATSLMPQKLVFNYSDIAPYFDKGLSPEEMKRDVLNILYYWKNKA